MFENVDVQTRNTSTQLRVFANEIESLEMKEVKQSEPIRFQTLQFASSKVANKLQSFLAPKAS